MKRYLIGFFFLIFIIALIPLPKSMNSNGAYNTFSRLIWCTSETSCYHETAHKIDQEGKWISESYDFKQAVRVYLLWQAKKDGKPDDLYDYIIFTPNMSYIEIYARIFEYSKGDPDTMPEQFRRFYDFQRAHELMQELR